MNDELNSSQNTSMSEQNSDTNQENIDNIEKQVAEPIVESEIAEEKSSSPIKPHKNKGKKLVIFIMVLIILLLLSLELFYLKDIFNNTNQNDGNDIATKTDEGNVTTPNDEGHVDTKYLYFYSKDKQTIEHYNDMSNSYGEYLGKYKCTTDSCTILNYYITKNYDFENKTILLVDESMLLYNYEQGKILLNNVASVYKDIIIITDNDKYAIADFNGKIISKYYDDILRIDKLDSFHLQNFSINKMLGEYIFNGKSGLLSLATGKELTEPIYDEIVIYNDTITGKNGDLEYLMDETGNIISKGFNKILYSKDNAIVIQEADEIDIVDRDGKSYLADKIKKNGQECSKYTDVAIMCMYIKGVENGFNIYMPANSSTITYFFDITTNKLTVQE